MADTPKDKKKKAMATPKAFRSPLAYENPAFTSGPEGRSNRILAEYWEPLSRFRKERIQDTVVFFGSARFNSMSSAQENLQLLEKPGSVQPAPAEEQPLGNAIDIDELEAITGVDERGELSLNMKRAKAAIEMARYYEDARRLAGMLTEWTMSIPSKRHRFVVTSGGGPGIMEAANLGAWEVGGKTIGLNIRLPYEQMPNPYITPALNFEFHYFFMRKYWFAYLAKALVVFPGGFGTMDELFELLTLAQTGKLAKKMIVIIYGREYWNRVVNFKALSDWGAISPKDLDLFHFADTPEEGFAILKENLIRHHLEAPQVRRRDGADGPEIAKTLG
ncbi:MAG TPA: TIGR00730 family Rossman fold protein [Terriglobales bacterium]|nr:TIGR00730 family Rossman fold protein [Terriglobales bacterium]